MLPEAHLLFLGLMIVKITGKKGKIHKDKNNTF